MATPIEGRRGRFQVDGSNAYVEEFSGTLETDRVECTTFEHQDAVTGRTAQRITDGVDKATVNVKGYVDADAMPATWGFTQGGDLTNVKLFFNKSVAGRCVVLSAAKVLRVNYSVRVHDKIMFDLNIESNGSITQAT